MKRVAWLPVALALCACQGEPGPGKPAGPVVQAPPGAPNILLVMVDDLGYADLGVTGSEIRTPGIDSLARRGVLLTDFHVTPVCFATRAALMTGVDHHTAGLGAGAYAVTGNQRGKPAYLGELRPDVPTLAERLRDNGYHTYMAGKWDLGSSAAATPDRRGFERSWVLLDGGASHFADGSGLVAFQRGAHYREDGRPVRPPENFYSSIAYTDQLIRYLEEQPQDGRPFFAYAAYTAPHWPLQVPDEWLDRYAGAYDAGYEALAEARLARMRTTGIAGGAAGAAGLAPQVVPWVELSPAERREEARRMELYAAMVELVDQQIARLLAWIEQSRFTGDTLVVFLSDNGPEGNSIDRLLLNRFWIPLAFDNSPDNLGRRGSYAWLSAGWARASATPFRLYKGYPTEGGYRVPAIVSWPGRFPEGTRESGNLTVTDLVATLLEIASADRDGPAGAPPLAGRSFRARLQDPASAAPNAGRALAIELFGRRAVRRDQWKALDIAAPFGAGRWQLYDLAADPAESRDLSLAEPQVMRELIAAWDAYAREVGVILPEGGEMAYGVPEVGDAVR